MLEKTGEREREKEQMRIPKRRRADDVRNVFGKKNLRSRRERERMGKWMLDRGERERERGWEMDERGWEEISRRVSSSHPLSIGIPF